MVFNPLGESLALVWDLIAVVISVIAVMMVVQINAAIQKSGKLDQVITRKLVHIFAGPVYIVTWLLFSGMFFSRFLAIIVPGLFILVFVAIGTGKYYDENMIASMCREGDPKELLEGPLHYAIIMVIISILWFYSPGTPAALIIMGTLAGGDGLADILGRKYGGDRKFGIGGSEKTLIGSIGMFIGSFLTCIILLAIFSLENPAFSLAILIMPVLVICIIATIVEALSPKGRDNWLIFISVVVVIAIFWLLIPSWWPYNLFAF
jgi:dolichol kinase